MEQVFGLQCRRGEDPSGRVYSVPLEKIAVSARVVDMAAEVKVVQTYVNVFPHPLDQCTYVFPLDESAAICAFEAVIAGKHIVGKVDEKGKARQTYDTAREAGQNAYLFEESRADVFSLSVGNLPPHMPATVTITYLTELRLDGKEYALVLPTYVAPRYTPAAEADPIPDGTITTAAKGLSLHVDFDMASAITAISSPSHEIITNVSNSEGSATLARSETALDKDVVIHVALQQQHPARVCVEVDTDGSKVAMVTLVPSFDTATAKCELVFVIDRSGSMDGSSIRQAADALQLFLKSLPTDCYFNIIGFGDRFDTLFPRSQKYGRETLENAVKYAKALRADFGGTELLPPLSAIYDFPIIDGYRRQVFVLTDGEVSNTQQVIDLVRKNAARTRTFTLGIGTGVSRHLVQGVARAGRGTAEYVTDSQRMNQAVIGQLKSAMQPAFSDVVVDWGVPVAQTASHAEAPPVRSLLGLVRRTSASNTTAASAEKKGTQTPFMVPPVFSGKRFFLYCFLDNGVATPSKVTVTAVGPDGPLAVELPVTSGNTYEGVSVMHRLAARSLVRDLEEGTSYLHVAPDGHELYPNMDAVKSEVVRVGLKYNLASRFTSFVAVDPDHPDVPPPPAYQQRRFTADEEEMEYEQDMAMASYGLVCGASPPLQAQAMSSVCRSAPQKCKKKSAGFSLPTFSMPSIFKSGSPAPSVSYGAPMAMKRSAAAPCPPGGAPPSAYASNTMPPPPPAPSRCMDMDMTCAPPPPPPPMARYMAPPPAPKCAATAPSPPSGVDRCMKEMAKSSSRQSDDVDDECGEEEQRFRRATTPPRARATTASEALLQLVQRQEFDGTFPLTPELAKVLGVDYMAAQTAGASAKVERTAWGTLLAVAFLVGRLGALAAEWELVATKAEEWLVAQLGADLPPARAAADSFVAAHAMVPAK